MEIIEIRHPYDHAAIPEEEIVLVLGFFDGVHLGHQKVIETGRKIAEEKGLKLALMTFNQHPSIVFQKVDPENAIPDQFAAKRSAHGTTWGRYSLYH